jgi:hypothetical protein
MNVLPLVGSSFFDGLRLERAERVRRLPAKRRDEFAVVGVSDLARPVIEFELLQGCQGAVAVLGEAHALTLLRRELREPVVIRCWLPQEGTSDVGDARDGKQDRKKQSDGRHGQAGA